MSRSEADYVARYREVDYEREFSTEDVARGRHRTRVGGRWDAVGKLQRDFLVAQGLRPEHTLLDVGCGALRGGVHFVDYLQHGHYYGIDINQSLLESGHQHELTEALRVKLPHENLRATERFEADFGVRFDYAIAQSVFTHISLNHVRLCLYRVAKVMAPGGRFYATFLEAPADHRIDKIRPGGRGTWTERDPFFYYRTDLEWAAQVAPWRVRHIGDWDHPMGQRMVEFVRLDGAVNGEGRKRTSRPGTPQRSTGGHRLRRVARRVPGARAVYRTIRPSGR